MSSCVEDGAHTFSDAPSNVFSAAAWASVRSQNGAGLYSSRIEDLIFVLIILNTPPLPS